LSLCIVYVSILVELIELQTFALDFLHCIDVVINHRLAVLDQLVPEFKVDEAMAEFYFSQDELQLLIGTQVCDGYSWFSLLYFLADFSFVGKGDIEIESDGRWRLIVINGRLVSV
jgi:hypothetical protein